jgi:cell division septal protein FtsQ
MDLMASRIQRHPWVQSVSVRREFPRTVKIGVRERVPFVYINQKKRFFIADDRGIVLGEAESYRWNLPVVYGVDLQGVEPGRGPVPSPLQKAIEVRRYLASDPDHSGGAFVGIEVTPRMDVVLHYKEMSVKLGGDRFPEKLKRLHEIEKKVAGEGLPLKEVDLRYGDQVVVRTL